MSTQDLVPFFNASWYAWQNPDCAGCSTPFSHYAEIGRFENRDPSPMIDMRRYGEIVGDHIPPQDRLTAIARGLRGPALGVYESWTDLDRAQEHFKSAIRIVRGPDRRKGRRRRDLVFLQAGARRPAWFDPDAPREWDLLVNYYDAKGYDPDLGDVIVFQGGTKFTAVDTLLRSDRPFLLSYDYVLLLDDDIMPPPGGIDALFAACRRRSLDLAQMALSEASSCIWDCLHARGRSGLRRVNAVEIMMPVLSRRALSLCAPHFARSVSGFGLDLLFGKLLAGAGSANVVVIDDIVADHLKPIDDADGAFYRMLRSRMINPKAELWRLREEHDLDLAIREVV